jgi:hypothetical protein
MGANIDTEIIKDMDVLKSHLSLRFPNRIFNISSSNMGWSSVFYINFYNLPSNISSHHPAEMENNRAFYSVSYSKGKVSLECVMSVFRKSFPLRKKTAKFDKLLEVFTDHISKIIESVPPNYTHTQIEDAILKS